MKRKTVDWLLWDLSSKANDVGTAATASPGSMCYVGWIHPHDVERAIEASISVRLAAEGLVRHWRRAGTGLLGRFRQWIVRGEFEFVIGKLHDRLDDARVGWHPRFGASYSLRSRASVRRAVSLRFGGPDDR